MKPYEPLDISGDAGLKIRGRTLENLFENAAKGVSELITDISKIKDKEDKTIKLESVSHENLLVLWLNELIFLFDARGFIGKSFSVSIKDTTLKAKASGGTFDPEINEGRLLIKAATYHGLSLKKIGTGWVATVIFDV